MFTKRVFFLENKKYEMIAPDGEFKRSQRGRSIQVKRRVDTDHIA